MPDERRPMPDKTRRERRLAEALRDNLRRRKEQARARERAADEDKPEPDAGRDR
jgi:hypothetical protein